MLEYRLVQGKAIEYGQFVPFGCACSQKGELTEAFHQYDLTCV